MAAVFRSTAGVLKNFGCVSVGLGAVLLGHAHGNLENAFIDLDAGDITALQSGLISSVDSKWLPAVSQCRSYFDWRMIRDIKRREMVREYYPLRTRVNAIRRNRILPKEIQEIADEEIQAFPRDSCYIRIRNRCAVTSRARGCVRRWRLSRIVWRSLADYNKLSGVTRSCW